MLDLTELDELEDELAELEFDPSLYGYSSHVFRPPVPPRPSSWALLQANERLRQRRRLVDAGRRAVPPRPSSMLARQPPYSPDCSSSDEEEEEEEEEEAAKFIVLCPDRPRVQYQQNLKSSSTTTIAADHAQLVVFAKQLTKRLFPPPPSSSAQQQSSQHPLDYLESALTRLFLFPFESSSPTSIPQQPFTGTPRQLWELVMTEYEANFPNSSPSYWQHQQDDFLATGEQGGGGFTARQVHAYYSSLLLGSSGHWMGKVSRFAVTVVFTSAMSREMDLAANDQAGGGGGSPLSDVEWNALLVSAKAYIHDYVSVCLDRLLPTPAAATAQLVDSADDAVVLVCSPQMGFAVRERIQTSILPVFTVGLRMFYDQVFGDKDRAIAKSLLREEIQSASFVQLAVRLGCRPSTAGEFDGELAHELLTKALFPKESSSTLSPIAQLDELVRAVSRIFSSSGAAVAVVGGDDLIALFVAAICHASKRRAHELKLASRANMLDDFGLTVELQGGQGGYVVSCLLTAVEVIAAGL